MLSVLFLLASASSDSCQNPGSFSKLRTCVVGLTLCVITLVRGHSSGQDAGLANFSYRTDQLNSQILKCSRLAVDGGSVTRRPLYHERFEAVVKRGFSNAADVLQAIGSWTEEQAKCWKDQVNNENKSDALTKLVRGALTDRNEKEVGRESIRAALLEEKDLNLNRKNVNSYLFSYGLIGDVELQDTGKN